MSVPLECPLVAAVVLLAVIAVPGGNLAEGVVACAFEIVVELLLEGVVGIAVAWVAAAAVVHVQGSR